VLPPNIDIKDIVIEVNAMTEVSIAENPSTTGRALVVRPATKPTPTVLATATAIGLRTGLPRRQSRHNRLLPGLFAACPEVVVAVI
jgi:hypothetical protein